MSGVRVPHRPPFLLRKNGERSRKASLHAVLTALHSKTKFFFTSSQIPASLACEVVSFRCRFIPLVKRSASLPVKLPPVGGWMCYFYSAASPLNFSTSKLIAAEHSSNGISDFSCKYSLSSRIYRKSVILCCNCLREMVYYL